MNQQTSSSGSGKKVRGSGMLAKLKTFSLLGIEAMPVEVEVDVSPRALPKIVSNER